MESRIVQEPEELLGIAWECSGAFESVPWYRGQADARWQLLPEVCRAETLRGLDRRQFEDLMVRNFRRQAEARLHDPQQIRTWTDWLALMQHHGLPTRLLDWSTSILVAAFFAVHEPEWLGRDGAIFVLDPLGWNEAELGRRTIATADDLVGSLACSLPFRDLSALDIGEQRELLLRLQDAIVAMEPHETFARMLLQQSRFTVHGRTTALESTPGASHLVRRLVIPARRKAHFARMLGLLGIRLSTVFPDLDHLAEELRDLAQPGLVRARRKHSA